MTGPIEVKMPDLKVMEETEVDVVQLKLKERKKLLQQLENSMMQLQLQL